MVDVCPSSGDVAFGDRIKEGGCRRGVARHDKDGCVLKTVGPVRFAARAQELVIENEDLRLEVSD